MPRMGGARIFAVWGQRGGRAKGIGGMQQQGICPWNLACGGTWGSAEGTFLRHLPPASATHVALRI